MLEHVIDSILAVTSISPPPVQDVFHLAELPEIPLHKYIHRIQRFTGYETNVFVQALIYVERLAVLGRVNAHTVHQLSATSISLSSKILLDRPVDNKSYASRSCSGIGSLLCEMECQILDEMDYRMLVTREEFEEKINLLNY